MSTIIQLQKFGTPGRHAEADYLALQKKLLKTSLFNFALLALLGLLMRAYPVFPVPFLSYKNLLHAHSHFAFGGWVTPVLLFLVLKFFPETRTASAYPHWRNCIVLMLFSAYGMLLSFSFQGYGTISIIFSTLSILAGAYAGMVIFRLKRQPSFSTSWSFLRAGFFYYLLSAVGPFATGPLIAMGKAGSPIYYNAVYFYLHFQYNGFFTFLVLAVLYKMIERNKPFNHGETVFRLLNIACIPTYFLSVLWSQPSIALNVLGGMAGILQLTAILWLVKDLKNIGWNNDWRGWLFRIALVAFIIKNILQLAGAIPFVADLAYHNRNFIIAYLHLVLLGFVSVFIFAAIMKKGAASGNSWLYRGFLFFLFAFISTEILLLLQAGGFLPILIYCRLIFVLSIFFPVAILLITHTGKKSFCLQLKP